jgi:hypothetical protein
LFTALCAGGSILIFGVVGLVLARALRKSKQVTQECAQQILNLGFIPQNPSDPTLSQRILWLRGHTGQEKFVTLRNVYRQVCDGAQVFFFDLEDRWSENISADDHLIAVMSPHLRLPRLVLIPTQGYLPGGRLLGGLAEGALKRIYPGGNDLHQLRLPQHPDFDQQYITMVENDAEATAFLTPSRQAWLMRSGQHRPHIYLGGDTFTLRLVQATNPTLPSQADGIRVKFDYALNLHRLFQN